MAIPNGEEVNAGHTMVKIRVEYEWKPPLCIDCYVFGHTADQCPKKVIDKPITPVVVSDDGFTTVVNRRSKGKGAATAQKKLARGFKNTKEGENNGIELKNLFEKLNEITSIADPNSDTREFGMASTFDATSTLMMILKSSDIGNGPLMLACVLRAAGSFLDGIRMWWFVGHHGFLWVILTLHIEDSFAGSSSMNVGMCDFKDCVKRIEVIDNNSFGLHYTWNQKPKGRNGILKKLDRIMCNIDFVDRCPGSWRWWLQIGGSNVEGHSMFRVVQKMKTLKKPLRKLLHDQVNLHDRVTKLRTELDEVQKAIYLDPSNSLLRDEEAVNLQTFNKAKVDEEIFLKQKAKIDWLAVGDSNSAFFHKSIKSRNQRSRIEVINNVDNVEVTGTFVPEVFVAHYEAFLGTSTVCDDFDTTGLFLKTVSDSANSHMISPVTNDEIKRAMFDIGNDKAPGQDVCMAIHDFFVNGQLLKEVNHTFLDLIPKVTTPLNVNDYHPISCCNVLYKCISKILTNHIIAGIKEVVSENQYAFVPGRHILDNILITQELMHNYHQNRGPPRCAFKVDIQKAYDTVSGLVPSIPKSTTFFCNALNHVKTSILNVMPFSEGELLVKYLGVPLISSRLLNKDCKVLVEKAQNLYWASVLAILFSIIEDIQQLIQGFLWCNGEYKRGKAKVAWDDIFLPKRDGGLGIRCLKVLNLALMTNHIWNIVSNKESLWVRWIHMYKLKGHTFWDICPKASMSWGWRKILQLRDIVKPFLWMQNGDWVWSQAWLQKAPNLGLIPVPMLSDREDCMRWRDGNGNMTIFSVKCAWEALRPMGIEVPCFSSKVWSLIRKLAGMDSVAPILEDIVSWFLPIAAKRTFNSIVGKLLFAASAFYILA
ncbi:sodium/hydrogen exchanger 6 [Tanacetum coccineum]